MNWFNLNDNVNMLALLGAAAIVIVTAFVVGKYIKQMKDDNTKGELVDESWDEIQEYKNPVPFGWAVIFILTIVWSIWYMFVGYPLNSYSQIGEYNEEVVAYNENFQKQWQNPSNEVLSEMGQGVFLVQCAPCHGVTGDGINGKATDLTTWGSEEFLVQVIKDGSKGLNYMLGEMPGGLIDAESAKVVSAYIAKHISAIKSTKNEGLVEAGEALWTACAACHGADGKGDNGMAPDLTKYGSAEFVVDVLNRGKKGAIGEMPAFNHGLLSDIQKKAVGTYINSLIK